MLPRMRRPLTFLLLLVGLLVAPASASAAVTAEAFGVGVILTSDGANDEITLTCIGGMAPGGGSPQVPCQDVEVVFVKGNGGEDTIKLENVGKANFPALREVEIDGGLGLDVVNGSQVEDLVDADSEDVVNSGGGNDLIDEGAQVSAGEGDDVMSLSRGTASGGSGDDRFDNPASLGPLSGGSGIDTFEFDFSTVETLNVRFEVEDGGLGIITGVDSGAIFWNSIERAELFLVDGGTQTVDASKFSGVLEADGRGGPDILIGGPGEDLLSGGLGDDDLTGGGGFDWVKGDAGADQLRLRDGEVDRGVCGDDADVAIADLADSLFGCESIDLPVAAASSAAPPPVIASDTAAPDTKGLKGPKKVLQGKSAVFRFTSTESGGTFKCRIDKGPLKSCQSPFKAKTGKLSPERKHAFSVFAVDSAGNADQTPATLKFSVEEKPKPGKRG